jgi:Flp pilus assembly pilin Flp
MAKIDEFIIDEESGQGMAEYAIIMALIVIAAVGALDILGEKTFILYDDAVSAITP